ncbi:MAG: Ig-like domain-containing protein [Thermoplasmatota archaeon]
MKYGTVSVMVILIIQVLMVAPWTEGDPVVLASPGPMDVKPTRTASEETPYGGVWYDDFKDLNNISTLDYVYKVPDGLAMNQVYFAEDFEAYQNSQNLIGVNGWIEDTNRPLSSTSHTFTASTGGPSPMPSNVIGEIYNPDDEYSFILSNQMYVTSGVVSCWFSTDHIWYGATESSSGMISLMKTQSATPSHDERVVGLLVRNGGVAYRTTPTSTSTDIISSGITANTWYRFVIMFDCSTDKASIYIYNSGGVLLGSALNIDFISTAAFIGRLELFTNRDHSLVFTTTYWDDIYAADTLPAGRGTVVSKTITLPEGMRWSTLRVDKEEYADTSISLEMLDASSKRIDGILYDPLDEEIDLRPLNDLGIRDIRLKAVMTPSGLISPLLKGWGIEWNRTGCFRDTFLTSLKVGYSTNIEIGNSRGALGKTGSFGMVESEVITLPREAYWGTFRAEAYFQTPSEITYDVLRADNGEPIPGYEDLSGTTFNISGLEPKTNKTIKLRAKFSSYVPAEMYVESWSLDWFRNTPPEVNGIFYNGTVLRNSTMTILVDVIDPQQSNRSLDIQVMVKPVSAGVWGTTFMGSPYFDEDREMWLAEFSPPISAQTGNFSLKVTANDHFNERSEKVIEDAFIILNNPPSVPEIEFEPESVGTDDDISVILVKPSRDVESLILLYTYRWFVNDVELEDEMAVDLWENYPPTLSSNNYKKGDKVECSVYSSDGESFSYPYFFQTVVGNTGPFMIKDPPKSVEIQEDSVSNLIIDIFDLVADPDGDELDIIHNNGPNLTTRVYENGSVVSDPSPDWFGEDVMSFFVSDGSENVTFEIMVKVLPVNDPPTGSITRPSTDLEIEVGDQLDFEAFVSDRDDPSSELIVTWRMNGSIVGSDTSVLLIFDDPGMFNISCHVTDGVDNVTIGWRIITVIDTTPVYAKEDFSLGYSSAWDPVLYDVIDYMGNIDDIRYGEDPGLNILLLGSELVGEQVRITMTLEGPPLDRSSDAQVKVTYYVFFIKEKWREPQLDLADLDPEQTDNILPGKDHYYPVGNYLSLGYLSFGEVPNTLGSPKVQGNNITWTLPMDIFIASNFPIEDYNLYGVAVYESQSFTEVTRGFDTIGSGAGDHDLSALPGDGGREQEWSLWWVIFIVAASFAVFAVVALLLIFVLVGRKKRARFEPSPAAVEDAYMMVGPSPQYPAIDPYGQNIQGLPFATSTIGPDGTPVAGFFPNPAPEDPEQVIAPKDQVGAEEETEIGPPVPEEQEDPIIRSGPMEGEPVPDQIEEKFQ